MNVNPIVFLDGDFLRLRDANVSPLTHSLSYATAVYEGIRCYDGNIYKLDEHLERLYKSAELLLMKPVIAREELKSAIVLLVKNNGLQDCYIKPMFFLDDADFSFMASDCGTRVFVGAFAFREPYSGVQNIALQTTIWKRPSGRCYPYRAKSSANYLLSYLAFHAMDREYDDVLFSTEDEYVTEVSGANIVFVKGNELVTPTTESCLAGITRDIVISYIAPRLGLSVTERRIHSSEIELFDGAFVCGTAVEIRNVSRIDQNSFRPLDSIAFIRHTYRSLCFAKQVPDGGLEVAGRGNPRATAPLGSSADFQSENGGARRSQ